MKGLYLFRLQRPSWFDWREVGKFAAQKWQGLFQSLKTWQYVKEISIHKPFITKTHLLSKKNSVSMLITCLNKLRNLEILLLLRVRKSWFNLEQKILWELMPYQQSVELRSLENFNMLNSDKQECWRKHFNFLVQ